MIDNIIKIDHLNQRLPTRGPHACGPRPFKKNHPMTDQINKKITLFTFVKLGKEVKEK